MVEGILKPGRYIGKEWNTVRKQWRRDMLKVALCFPDIYEIGMSHLGIKILYGILNQEHDIACERVFAPWSDMERKMRREGTQLLSLESRKMMREFDIIGFSLQYEMNYVDVLNMLNLAGIEIFSKRRQDDDPLIIAGGPCALNPEPMIEFIDAFVIGEAEEAILEIGRVVKSLGFKVKGFRDEVLKEISEIDGVYVPALGPVRKNPEVKKRLIKDLDNAFFPTEPIVPYIQIIHDRIGIEIMRGCPHRCKFCQACRTFYPYRLRSVERILEIARDSVKSTGYEEISLLSLSTGDYPYMTELIARLDELFRDSGVRVSLPSLRIGSFDRQEGKAILRRKGLTFAPESGSDELRERIGKKITNDEIIRESRIALNSGWRKVKLYFMIGLPGETQKDLDAIVELVSRIKKVNLSIACFIPKPHSEFEREAMEGLGALEDKKRYLGYRLRVKANFHNPEMSKIEAILARGDRKVCKVIYKVWQKGARLQAWNEHFDYRLWMECFTECGIDPDVYLKRAKENETLPWGFIQA